MIIYKFIITDIEKNTQANMNREPKIMSNYISSAKVLDISSPSMIQNKLKNAMLGSRNLKVGQNTASPSMPKPMKKGSMLAAWRMMFGPA